MGNTAPIEVPEIAIPYHYAPRGYQLPVLSALDGGIRRAVIVWHRRAGKEKTLLNWTIGQMVDRVGAYYYFFPTYAQGKKILWKGVDRDGFKFMDHFPPEIVVRKNESDLSVELVNGSIFQIVGTDNYDAVVGTNPIGCVFSEYSLQDPVAWELFRPILRENGGWAIFNLTPRGDNHAKELFDMASSNPDWFAEKLSVLDTKRPDGTPVISPAMIDADRREGMSEEMIQQEYYCSFHGCVEGAYFMNQYKQAITDGRITSVPYDERLPTQTWWDLGMDDSTSIWITQPFGREIRVIDYIEDTGEGFAYYAKKLKERPYLYKDHNGPHDSAVRELSTGKTRAESLETLGVRPFNVVPKVRDKMDAIQAARSIFSRCYFDEKKCARGLKALKNYQKEWDEKKKVFKKKPLHNWACHGADGFLTLATGYKDVVAKHRGSYAGTPSPEGWMGN